MNGYFVLLLIPSAPFCIEFTKYGVFNIDVVVWNGRISAGDNPFI